MAIIMTAKFWGIVALSALFFTGLVGLWDSPRDHHSDTHMCVGK